MKKLIIVFMSIILSLMTIAIVGILWLQKDIDASKELVIPLVDMESILDGTYEGQYDNGRFSTTVEVVVSNHTITEVHVIDDVTFYKEDVTQLLIDQVTSQNGLDVDGVSGATATVNAYLMAIYDALNQGETA